MNSPEATTHHIVWFKRDLRIRDHLPLVEAAKRGQLIPLFIIEPELIAAPDFSPRHWGFLRSSLEDLREQLARLGQPLIVRNGDPVEIFKSFRDRFPIEIWCHEETGNWLSYQRDRRVRRWARDEGVLLHEYPANGVIRRLENRAHWAAMREERLAGDPLAAPVSLKPIALIDPGPIPESLETAALDIFDAGMTGGESSARKTLDTFLSDRCQNYAGGISSPLTAETACSRLSPYLAWGNLSSRQVLSRLKRELAVAPGYVRRSLQSFESRIHWRCHFMQKLEDEPEIEFRNFVRAYDGLREDDFDEGLFAAWCEGRTGYPMIDACMRKLRATGWINFRMRSMLVAFAAYDLWLHWRKPAQVLAQLFIDYEPGIHYPQMQMQSGTAGHATIRLYNPVKQGLDHDPEGRFIRRWLPELERVPTSFIHSPWLLPGLQQKESGCVIGRDYPAPVVDHEKAVREARARIAIYRKRPELKEEIARTFARHGSRRRMPQVRSMSTRQLELFPS